jgi:electron transfer flavoprotein-quinone oxidoreductase
MTRGWDAIVVGAGPAGAAAALVMARAGLHVLLLERGETVGSKNVFGGILHTHALAALVPDFADRAPLERHVVRRAFAFLTDEGSLTLQIGATDAADAYTVRRPLFDRWFAEEARAAGAVLVPATVVDDVVIQDGRVVGIETRRRDGRALAPIVVGADGVNSVVARRAGARPDFPLSALALGVKQVFALAPGVIEERFGVRDRQGVALEAVGHPTRGMQGGGFVYTNHASLSVGVICRLDQLAASGVTPEELLSAFEAHPAVSPWLRGAEPLEYGAHLLPLGAADLVPRLASHGLLLAGDAAGLLVSRGVTHEGANLAMASGAAAGVAAVAAHRARDFSATTLERAYRAELARLGVTAHVDAGRRVEAALRAPELYAALPEVAWEAARRFVSVGDGPPVGLRHALRLATREGVSAARLGRVAARLVWGWR